MANNDGQNWSVEHDALRQDIDRLANLAKEVGEANGSLRSAIKDVIENRGYHKAALADVRKIDAMSDSKLADYLRTFIPMMEAMQDDWNGRIEDMVDQMNDEAGE